MSKPSLLINKNRLQKKVKELSLQISQDYKGKEIVLVGVLKGSFVFLADLMRQLSIPALVDFIQVSSYGKGTRSSRTIKIKKDIDLNVRRKHIIIVEDIVDCGRTLQYILNFLKKKKPASLSVCALLDKPSRREIEVPITYKGFEIPDKFVVGYGLDCAEKFRNFPNIRSIPA